MEDRFRKRKNRGVRESRSCGSKPYEVAMGLFVETENWFSKSRRIDIFSLCGLMSGKTSTMSEKLYVRDRACKGVGRRATKERQATWKSMCVICEVMAETKGESK